MSDNQQKDTQQVILCDMCTEEDRKPARKTCMKCEISMCVQHLQVHLTTPVLLQTHPLTEPMACGTTKCPQHGKLLEYYCLDDMTCVCVSCAIEDQHRLHNMKTFSTAHKELMEKLTAEQKALRVKTDDENVSLEKWEKSEREKLGYSSLRLIEAVTKMRDISLTSVCSSVTARMVSIKTSKSSMQAAQNEKDTFRFLQMYSQVHRDVEKAKVVDLRKGLEHGSDRDKLVQEIRQHGEKVMQQARDLWGSLLTLVDPDQELLCTRPDLMFKPQIFGNGMSLSNDNRRVFFSSWMGQCNATLLISSTLSVSNFQRWQVCLSKDCDWTIGLCDKKSAEKLQNGPMYGLCCKNNQLSSLWTDECFDASTESSGFGQQTTAERKLSFSSALITHQEDEENEGPVSRPEMVEVFWNFAASSLSFFRRSGLHQREEIITIKMSINNWDLAPFVQLEGSDVSQSQGKCRCGGVFKKNVRKNSLGIAYCNCCCREMISSRRITEVVCELM
ncbi:tripartite motif-containing protein 16 [Paralichthys olivaceus]|uniref:tripartite motif-containing protein 16 n=1 Tax=Paralichthys olivaceus TaxID=8255 RepID=UPI00375038B6